MVEINAGNDILATDIADLTPLGVTLPYAGASAPTAKWMICDGTAINRTTYADLFAIIGTTFGVGDGATTFNIPNMEGKFPIGKDSSHALGATGGTFTIAEANLPAHTHSISSDGGHNHDVYGATPGVGTPFKINSTSILTADEEINPVTTTSEPAHNHGAATGGSGSGTDYKQPYLSLNYIIRVSN